MQPSFLVRTLVTVLALGAVAPAFSAAAAARRHAAAPRAAEPAPPKEQIAYENLHGYLGDRITVHTTYHTTRTGTLARFSQAELTLTIETPGGPTELTIPKNTIRDIVPASAASH